MNLPILDLGEQLHTGANPSHNSSKPQHLKEIMAELLGSSQTYPTRCKPQTSTQVLQQQEPHCASSPGRDFRHRGHRRYQRGLGVLDVSGTRFALFFQVSLCLAME